MNARPRKIPTEFGPETRFEIPPQPAVPFRGTLENDLERLKGRLLQLKLAEYAHPAFNSPLRRAAHDAAALVWFTPFPLLLLPELFAEKARVAIVHTRRQQRVFTRSRATMAEAACTP
jgi:hypothetical protein